MPKTQDKWSRDAVVSRDAAGLAASVIDFLDNRNSRGPAEDGSGRDDGRVASPSRG